MSGELELMRRRREWILRNTITLRRDLSRDARFAIYAGQVFFFCLARPTRRAIIFILNAIRLLISKVAAAER